MANSKLLTEYLDQCELALLAQHAATTTQTEEARQDMAAAGREMSRLFQACLDSGWSIDAIDAAWHRRFAKK